MTDSLDIDCARITEWLLERRKIPKEFNKQLKALELKSNQVCQQMAGFPDASIVQTVEEEKDRLDYQTICVVMQRLEDT